MSFVEHLVEFVGEEFDEFMDPAIARGECEMTSKEIRSMFNWDSQIHLIEMWHYNDPDGRYYELNQHSNHYAVYVPAEKLIVDYTLRQFDPSTPFPFIGTRKQWRRVLEASWDTKKLHSKVHKR